MGDVSSAIGTLRKAGYSRDEINELRRNPQKFGYKTGSRALIAEATKADPRGFGERGLNVTRTPSGKVVRTEPENNKTQIVSVNSGSVTIKKKTGGTITQDSEGNIVETLPIATVTKSFSSGKQPRKFDKNALYVPIEQVERKEGVTTIRREVDPTAGQVVRQLRREQQIRRATGQKPVQFSDVDTSESPRSTETISIVDRPRSGSSSKVNPKENPKVFSSEFFKEAKDEVLRQTKSTGTGFKKATLARKDEFLDPPENFQEDVNRGVTFRRNFATDPDIKAAKKTTVFVTAAAAAPVAVSLIPKGATILNTVGNLALAKTGFDFAKNPTPKQFVETGKVATVVLGPRLLTQAKQKITKTNTETSTVGKVSRVVKGRNSIDVAVTNTRTKITKSVFGKKIETKTIDVKGVSSSATKPGKGNQFFRKTQSAFEITAGGKKIGVAGSKEITVGQQPTSQTALESGLRKTQFKIGEKNFFINEKTGTISRVVVDKPGSKVIESLATSAQTKGSGLGISSKGNVLASRSVQKIQVSQGELVKQQFDVVSKGFGGEATKSFGASFKPSTIPSRSTSLTTQQSITLPQTGSAVTSQLQQSRILTNVVSNLKQPEVTSLSRPLVPVKAKTITQAKPQKVESVVFLPETKVSTKIAFKTQTLGEQRQKPVVRSVSVFRVKTRIRSDARTASSVAPKVKQEVAAIGRQLPAQRAVARTRATTRSEPRTQQQSVFSRFFNFTRNSSFGAASLPVPRIPFAELNREANNIGFLVQVRRKGQFKNVNSRPLIRGEALSLGSKLVSSSAAATFRLKPAGKASPTGLSTSFSAARFVRKNTPSGTTFIEKNRFRIDTAGELKDITFKGIRAPRRKKKKKKR